MPVLNSINQMQKEMKDWRQDLHQIPEIGLEEFKTSEFLGDKIFSSRHFLYIIPLHMINPILIYPTFL